MASASRRAKIQQGAGQLVHPRGQQHAPIKLLPPAAIRLPLEQLQVGQQGGQGGFQLVGNVGHKILDGGFFPGKLGDQVVHPFAGQLQLPGQDAHVPLPERSEIGGESPRIIPPGFWPRARICRFIRRAEQA